MSFPVPGDAFEQSLDLNRHLISNPAATFFMQVDGETQRGEGAQIGDLLIVDRSQTPRDGALVVAAIAGELAVLRVQKRQGQLIPAGSDWPSDSELQLEVWGVVTTLIRKL